MECPECGHELSGYDGLPKVWILLDAMERFQGVFKSSKDATDHLIAKHGEVMFETVNDGLNTLKATCPDGSEYTIERHTV